MQYLEEELETGLATDRPRARGGAGANAKSTTTRSAREAGPAREAQEPVAAVEPRAPAIQVDEDEGAEDGEIVE